MSQQKNVAQTTLAQRLSFKRENAGLSMRELARKSGVDVGYISRIEQGLNENLGFEKARGIAEALSISVDWLLSGREGVSHTRETKTVIDPSGKVIEASVEERGNQNIPLVSEFKTNPKPCQMCAIKDCEIAFLREALDKALDRIPKA